MAAIERGPRIVVEVSEERKAQVEEIAKKKGMATAVYVRTLLYQALEKEIKEAA